MTCLEGNPVCRCFFIARLNIIDPLQLDSCILVTLVIAKLLALVLTNNLQSYRAPLLLVSHTRLLIFLKPIKIVLQVTYYQFWLGKIKILCKLF